MYNIIRYGRFFAGMVLLLTVFFSFRSFDKEPEEPVQAPEQQADSIDILHYTLNINITDLRHSTICGIADIQAYTLVDSVHTVRLLLEPPLTIDSVWIDEEPVRFRSGKGNHVVIYLPAPADKENTILMTFFYQGHPAHDPLWGGFYFVHHTAFNMGVGMNVIPHPFGRAWFPCRDNFNDKATYDYFITVPDTLTAACPGTLQEIITNRDGTHTFHWNIASPIPTYLSSVAVSKYKIINDSLQSIKGLIPAQYFVIPENEEKAVVTFSHVQSYLNIFETLFGPYTWEKIGYAEVPFPHGAMEHATCISVPDYVVDGTHDHDALLVHEFSHSWFGNLVTCRSAGDMWLNEGWATYSEALYLEFSKGRKDYLRHITMNHRKVLQFAHINDHGYYALAGVPQEITYGTTVYKKGADIVHTLRNFLGDKVFFDAVKQYFQTYTYGNISTEEFEHFLSRVTHRNMQDFFNAWIYTPGFPHYSLDSTMIIRDRNDFIIGLFIRQRPLGRKEYTNNLPVEVTLLDDSWQEHRFRVTVSGSHQRKTLITSFSPLAVMINTDQFVSDATSSGHRIIRHPGNVSFNNCFFRLKTKHILDSAYVRVIHHWIGPEYIEHLPPEVEVSTRRYWSIEGIFPDSVNWRGSFYYNFTHSLRNGYLDTLSSPGPTDILSLLYRPSLSASWRILPTEMKGTKLSGYLITDSLRKGDYCLAIRRSTQRQVR